MILLIFIISFMSSINVYAKSVNVYAWGGEIPAEVVRKFEDQTGIQVNFSTYDSNETMYAKLRANSEGMYDVILPSTYFVERMQDILLPLEHKKLPNLTHIDKFFLKNQNKYGIPFIWGATGIFYNQKQIINKPQSWQDLWRAQNNQLMLLNDPREIFAIALLKLGYHPQDSNPYHIQQAYKSLLELTPKIKLFSSEGIQALMIDGDSTLGTAWNGDVFKANSENNAIKFIYPKEGYIIWIDCLSIPKNAPHINEAYTFINFLLKPEIAAYIALKEGHAITNKDGKNLLPKHIRSNTTIYPSEKTMQRAYIQHDISNSTMELYHELWQKLKMSF